MRLAIVPSTTLGIAETEAAAFDDALRAELATAGHIGIVAQPEVIRALPGDVNQCNQSDECLINVGRKVNADSALSVTVAGLDDVRLVRVRLFDVTDGVIVQDLQETVSADDLVLKQYAGDLRQRLFPSSVAPWHKKWWVWTTAVVVIGASVGLTWWAVEQPRADDRAVHLGDL
ncbi:MAG: hypothetical protein A2289_01005 [Deltaproteobacteria bacterium RIFOXYA12_FULL_58_15]|nr:MAG: hypothetical protein A2289_01005 [Deltaproteobacteria bacterium RIFOXYA12_FULL_58_15]OGR14746.1 MAG: hypothetical protein A2341_05210 [Deltaproteobacteria bacterium RIFOXYB12_FULL_58_9]